VKRLSGLSEVLIGGTLALVATSQAAQAALVEVTSVQLTPKNNGIDLVLSTQTGNRPKIFTLNQGNDLIADISNTQLHLSEDSTFRQENPAPGIAAVAVDQVDANNVRITVSGYNEPPSGQVVQQALEEGIAFHFSSTLPHPDTFSDRVDNLLSEDELLPASEVALSVPDAEAQAEIDALSVPDIDAQLEDTLAYTSEQFQGEAAAVPLSIAQAAPRQPVQDRQRLQPRQQAQPRSQSQSTPRRRSQDVLVPNPEVTIDGVPAQPLGTARPISPTPPLLPRAIAPPVGDIAISTMNAAPSLIDVGSAERIPRLVLRDAPVREVLALLARAAGLNLAYIGDLPLDLTSGRSAARSVAREAEPEPTVTLDIENESVQDVFNHVLRITGMEANRVGRTVFVGPRLPNDARNIVVRSLRMNQVPVADAANFLSAQGAQTQLPITRVRIETIGQGDAQRVVEIREPEIIALEAEESTGPLVLRGLSILTDERLNAITLVGHPRKVEMATRFLQQLDARRRQVAVNIKIVDVNLSGLENFNTSFSFGVADSFFTQQNGQLTGTFGDTRPPTTVETRASTVSPTLVNAPFPAGATQPFIDNQPDAPFGNSTANDPFGAGQAGFRARPPFGTFDNPLQPGLTDFTAGTGTTADTFTFGLPEIFQFPRRFLAQLQAEIVSNNAKILTDPTLIVQEGQTADVNLTQEIVGNRTVTITTTDGGTLQTENIQIDQVGLVVSVNVDRIDDNGFVSIRVNPLVSSPLAQQETSTTGGTFTLTQQRSLNSGLVRLRDGQTLILAGIIQDQDRTTVRKVPILGDIPLLGALFRSTTRQNDRSEVVVLVTPNILDDSERSTFGYGYVPGDETRQLLQRNGAFEVNQR